MSSPWVWGELARHRRGRILEEAVGARPPEPADASAASYGPARPMPEPADASAASYGPARPLTEGDLPGGHGLVLMFASEFQDAPQERQRAWAGWCDEPGRCLLLVPPFRPGEVDCPRPWRAHPIPGRAAPLAEPLQTALAPEARYYLTGKLQAAEALGGVWADGTVNTGFFRRHPRAGILAVTCLPVWSVVVLEHKARLAGWFAGLIDLAGPAVVSEVPQPAFTPGPEHLVVLLHLASGDYAREDDALAALGRSPFFRLDPELARVKLAELRQAEMVSGCAPTARGRDWLLSSPYAPYLEALQEVRP